MESQRRVESPLNRSEESVSASGLPPERCLSEGNLVDSSPPAKDQLGGLGGRIWRAVPSSMESLPKSLQSELANKIGSRGHSISEDEGLPHSPPTDQVLEEKMSKRTRASSQEDPRPVDRILPAPLGPQTSLLSQSARSLMSCDGSSDGENFVTQSLDLDFNDLRRSESLDNTAAKHKIQVSRPRKSRASSNPSGGLRKHKSMSTVQLSGISEEVTPDDSIRRRAPSSDLLTSGPSKPFSPAAFQLAQELTEMQLKKDKAQERKQSIQKLENETQESAQSPKLQEKKEVKAEETKSSVTSSAITVSRVNKTPTTADSKVTRLRSMFGPSTSIDSPSEAPLPASKPKPSPIETKPKPSATQLKPKLSVTELKSKPSVTEPKPKPATDLKPKQSATEPKLKLSVTEKPKPSSIETKPKPSTNEAKTHKFFSATTPIDPKPPASSQRPAGASIVFSKTYGVSGPPPAGPVKSSKSGKPKLSAIRQSSFPEKAASTETKKKVSVEKRPASTFISANTKSPLSSTTDKGKTSSEDIEIRAKKPAKEISTPNASKSAESGGRPVSKVKDLVKNFQRLQDTTS